MRALLGFLAALLWAGLSLAQERITQFDVDVQIETSGDIIITETINVISEGNEINRGIFRELPARYTFMGVSQSYDYTLLSIERDGAEDTVTDISNGNAITWRIGKGDVLLDPGPHQYVIRYRLADVIRRHGDRDELFLNCLFRRVCHIRRIRKRERLCNDLANADRQFDLSKSPIWLSVILRHL